MKHQKNNFEREYNNSTVLEYLRRTFMKKRLLNEKVKEAIFDVYSKYNKPVGVTQKSVALAFGVTQGTVSQIIKEKTNEQKLKKRDEGDGMTINNNIINNNIINNISHVSTCSEVPKFEGKDIYDEASDPTLNAGKCVDAIIFEDEGINNDKPVLIKEKDITEETKN